MNLSPQHRAKISAGLMDNTNCLGNRLTFAHRENLRVAQKVIELFKPDVLARKRAVSSAKLKLQMEDPAFREKLSAGLAAYRERRRLAKAPHQHRWQHIADMRAAGMTLKAIGVELGVSYQRVSQILAKIARRAA